MEIKQTKSQKVFGREIKTSLKTIKQYVQVVPQLIIDDMIKRKIEIKGAQVWMYKGMDGKPDTVFDLTIGFPVDEGCNDESIIVFNEFKYVSLMHKGSWMNFTDSYNKIIGSIMKDNLQMSGESREIYHNVDFENQENNLTEIQIGVL